MLAKLNDPQAESDSARIANMQQILTIEKKQTLMKHREYNFLEQLLRLLGLSLEKGSLAFFKSQGGVLANQLEESSLNCQSACAG